MCLGEFIGGENVTLNEVDYKHEEFEILVLAGFYILVKHEEEGIAEFEDFDSLSKFMVGFYDGNIPEGMQEALVKTKISWEYKKASV